MILMADQTPVSLTLIVGGLLLDMRRTTMVAAAQNNITTPKNIFLFVVWYFNLVGNV